MLPTRQRGRGVVDALGGDDPRRLEQDDTAGELLAAYYAFISAIYARSDPARLLRLKQLGACAGKGFGGDDQDQTVKRLCEGCHLQLECLDYAIALDEAEGVWGGLTRNERAVARTTRSVATWRDAKLKGDLDTKVDVTKRPEEPKAELTQDSAVAARSTSWLTKSVVHGYSLYVSGECRCVICAQAFQDWIDAPLRRRAQDFVQALIDVAGVSQFKTLEEDEPVELEIVVANDHEVLPSPPPVVAKPVQQRAPRPPSPRGLNKQRLLEHLALGPVVDLRGYAASKMATELNMTPSEVSTLAKSMPDLVVREVVATKCYEIRLTQHSSEYIVQQATRLAKEPTPLHLIQGCESA